MCGEFGEVSGIIDLVINFLAAGILFLNSYDTLSYQKTKVNFFFPLVTTWVRLPTFGTFACIWYICLHLVHLPTFCTFAYIWFICLHFVHLPTFGTPPLPTSTGALQQSLLSPWPDQNLLRAASSPGLFQTLFKDIFWDAFSFNNFWSLWPVLNLLRGASSPGCSWKLTKTLHFFHPQKTPEENC